MIDAPAIVNISSEAVVINVIDVLTDTVINFSPSIGVDVAVGFDAKMRVVTTTFSEFTPMLA